jgi:NADPH:quinone reductase-like Zn-dependent oxidoreductase
MKAIVCTGYGPPEVLKLTELTKPVPLDDEVLIKVHATTVTVADYRIRSFTVPPVLWLPARIALGISKPRKPILGVELAGEIEAVGKHVTLYKEGDQVFAASLKDFGGYAEYKCLPEDDPIAIKPTNISYEEAAALPIGARTALYFLKKGDIRPGQKVLVYGASGSVGSYAVQLARYFGANVTGVCGASNLKLVESLGADKVIDYADKDFCRQLGMYDVIFVAIDKFPFSIANKILNKGGVFINITNPIKSLNMILASVTGKKKIIMGGNVPETAEFLRTLKDLVEAGNLKAVVDKVYSFDQIVEAHRYVGGGHKKGNVVIRVP